MEYARRHKERLIQAYTVEKKSTYQIAEELGTYPNKIRSALLFLGVELRDYKSAQKTALETGRSAHPTEGKALTDEHKRRVGRARSKAWSSISETERERLSQIGKAQWAAMTEEEKAELRRLAAKAVRESSKEGSQAEKYIVDRLRQDGWTVNFHLKGLVVNDNLEVDMFLPELRTAIEIDGPAHFLPIWGEESLKKHQAADMEKEGLLINAGYVLIRVKQLDKSMSITKLERLYATLKPEIEKIAKKFPDKTKRLIEIEVQNGEVRKDR